MKIEKALVIGAGTMGHGIAELLAIAGYKVYLSDVAEDFLKNAVEKIRWSLSKLQERGELKENADAVMSRITTVIGLPENVKDADFAIEAVTERLDVKADVFSRLSNLLSSEAILATNTSSLPVSRIAEYAKNPERVVGMHFFNPPALMPLVEVMKGEKTSDEVAKTVYELAKKLGKQPIMINKDVPGYVVNRILGSVNAIACLLVEKGVADYKTVDAVAKYKLAFPMGIFELLDYTGIDVAYYVSKSLQEFDKTSKIPLSPLIQDKFNKKELGVKSGKGFYTYPQPGKYVKPEIPKEAADKLGPELLIALGVNEAARLLREGIASRNDIDLGVKLGLGWPKGIFQYADELGVDKIVQAINQLNELGGLNISPDPLLISMVKENKLGVKSGKGFYEYGQVEERRYSSITLRIEPPLAWIVLNRPDRLNALSMDMVNEINKTLDELELNDNVRVVIITGNGRAFSAGADVTSFLSLKPIDLIRLRTLKDVFNKISLYTKPVIAALNGYALGGGLEMAMACDIRIASESARLGQPEINLGLIPGAGGTQRLPKLVGKGRAKLIIYTGDMIDAKDAYEMGLVDLVVPDNAFEEEVRRVALKIAEKSPLSLLAAKMAIELGYDSNIFTGGELEATLFGLLLTTEDVKEGVTAFLSKRKPNFKGK